MSKISRHIHINGIVQGVGFRPFVYNLAKKHDLTGWVRNSASGVDIEVTGELIPISAFQEELSHNAPPLAQIDSIDIHPIETQRTEGLTITSSEDRGSDFIPISPDIAICDQCKSELFNPQDRRFRYPFINCTNCGPRFSIIKNIPYDRPKTTMASFEMCSDCQKEYNDPQDRRFHAQPVACPVCGPQVWLEFISGKVRLEKDNAIKEARRLLKEGKILAIKGLGGFHLACDATNPEAVRLLRERKNRPGKPFAMMAFDMAAIRKYAEVTAEAENLLSSLQAPIVLLPKNNMPGIADEVAPGQSTLGFMLPYTPLHLLLLEPEPGYPDAFVMTSGNLIEEPILHTNQSAQEELKGIADAFLLHDRPIFRRIDDSVFAMVMGEPYQVRRARGYAPNPIRLNHSLPQVLAVGPQMKNTFCLTRDKYAFLSHHIGEMDNWETYLDYQNAIQQYEELFRIQPQAIGYDLHPDYTSTKYALKRSAAEGIPKYPVQHHHAHLAACMIENGCEPEEQVAGFIFDGTGYGTDGTIWGGEILIGNCYDFSRFAYLKPVPLPGGDISIQKPSRMVLSTLWAYDIPWSDHLAPVQALTKLERETLKVQLDKNLNAPLTSSMGRLFDAVSSLIGIRQSISYEAQAAVEMEALAEPKEMGYYPWQLDKDQIMVKPLIESILEDQLKGETTAKIAAKFHNSIARITVEIAKSIQQAHGIHQFVLSGGVWQNRLLLENTLELMQKNNLMPMIHHQMPPNDGCVAFGQAVITAFRYLQDKE